MVRMMTRRDCAQPGPILEHVGLPATAKPCAVSFVGPCWCLAAGVSRPLFFRFFPFIAVVVPLEKAIFAAVSTCCQDRVSRGDEKPWGQEACGWSRFPRCLGLGRWGLCLLLPHVAALASLRACSPSRDPSVSTVAGSGRASSRKQVVMEHRAACKRHCRLQLLQRQR